ncbi:MAG: hypothetical protein NC346_02265 [Prevotella sp.]|nr:hypothetical protein [Bacteroidales bacterium]MCM1068698.1 hypothetical protein [Prevotella sp.]
MSKIRPRTYEDVLISNHPTLKQLAGRSEAWKVFTLAYIATAIAEYLDFVGRRQTMNDGQVAQTAELIFEEYGGILHFDDIALFFRLTKLGKYGHLYEISGVVLLEYIKQYLNDRSWQAYSWRKRLEQEKKDAIERQQQEEWNALSDEEKVEMHAKIKEAQDRILKKFSNN